MSMASNEPNARYEARFSDGQTAQSHEVTTSLTARGIAIYTSSDAEPLIWPYGALATSEPLTNNSIEALVRYTHQPGASLFVPGSAFARQLRTHAKHLTASAQRWRDASPWLWTATAIIGVVLIVWLAGLSPARTVAGFLPDTVRTSLGKQVVASMTQGKPVCDNVDGRRALNALVARLTRAAKSDAEFKVTVAKWKVMNAFATPGEQIVITSRLIARAKTPDELAGVIAHEMGHGIELHPETAIVRALGLTAAAELMLGGSSGTLSNIGLVLAQLSYSRAAEREADTQALRILRNAEISPNGLAAFFGRVARLEGSGKKKRTTTPDLGFLRTHPDTRERILKVKNAAQYPSTPALSDVQWQALREICKQPPAQN